MTAKFSCDFCEVVLPTADSCRAHEEKCDYNPDNKTCAQCVHRGYARTTIERDKLNWKSWGTWENEDDIPEPYGCLLLGDQVWRRHCESFQLKKPNT